jgi:hypothetical protein
VILIALLSRRLGLGYDAPWLSTVSGSAYTRRRSSSAGYCFFLSAHIVMEVLHRSHREIEG